MERNIILERRSVYPVQFTGEIIHDDIIWEILNDANNAPSHRNTEPWRFQVYTGNALSRLKDQLINAYKDHVPEADQKLIKIKKIEQKTEVSSHVIVISRKLFDPPVNPEWEEIASIGCSVENIYLSCTSRRLGCYWSTPGYLVGKKTILDLPEDEDCLGLVYIGVPDPEKTRQVIKKPLENKVVWHG